MRHKKAPTAAKLKSMKHAKLNDAKGVPNIQKQVEANKRYAQQRAQQITGEHMNARMQLLKACIEAGNEDDFDAIWDEAMQINYPNRVNVMTLAASHVKNMSIPMTPKGIVDAAKESLETLHVDAETFFTDPEGTPDEIKNENKI